MSNKKQFRNTRTYPVLFMILITIVFVGILATLYGVTQNRIKNHQETKLKETILKTFDLEFTDLEKTFSEKITIQKKDEFIYYEANDNNHRIGYCFPIYGKGLWGSISAILSVTPNLEKIINLEIVSQNETPGLGARISENWFKKQFSDKIIFADDSISDWKLVNEYEKTKDDEINQVTGATASSSGTIN